MINRLRLIMAGISLLCAIAAGGYAGISNGTANLVLGQGDFSADVGAAAGSASLNDPNGIAIDTTNGRVFVADTFNNRVLWWDNMAGLTNGKAATGVLGQTVFTDSATNRGGAVGPGTFDRPVALWIDTANRLWVVDAGNSRVLRFDSPTTKATADFVLGQPDMLSWSNGTANNRLYFPLGMAVSAAGDVWVVDEGNNRVVRFPSGSTVADVVIGQTDFVSSTNDVGVSTAPASASTLNHPQGAFVDAAGNLWVGEDNNNRVLRFSPPFTTGMSANLVLGQADFVQHANNRGGFANAGTVLTPMSITSDNAGNLWVADFNNNRILRYSGTLTSGMNAVQVIGQPDFTSTAENRGGTPAANSLFHPNCVTVDASGTLWVCEGGRFSNCNAGGNNRVLKFNGITVLSIDPLQWHNGGKKTITVKGSGFLQGTTVKLTRAGQSDIVGTNVTISADASQVQVTFDLTGVAPGSWNLAIQSGGFSALLANVFTVFDVKITAVTPVSGINDHPVDVTISGSSFFNGLVPSLTKPGQADVPGQSVVLVSSSQITCRFDITDVTTGFWNVSVTQASDGILASAFDVHFPSSVARNILRSNTYHLGMETVKGVYTFDIFAGTFSNDIFFTADLPQRPVPPVTEKEFKASEVAIELVNDKNLQPQKEVGIGFFYMDAHVTGLDRMKLAACYCDEPTGRWIPVNSRADGTCVRSKTRHLCIFRLVQLVASDTLTTLKVYPNPYTPGSGNGYDDPMLGQGIVFAGLTGRANLKIFTIAGELVLQHDESNGSGIFVWDTKNDKGEKTASGVYLYYITNPDNGSEKQKGKFAIIR